MHQENDFEVLMQAPLCVLRMPHDAWRSLAATRRAGSRFSLNFPHDELGEASKGSLVILDIDAAAEPLRLGLIRSKRATTTLDSALSIDVVVPLAEKRLGDALGNVTESELRVFRDRLTGSTARIERISPKLGEAVLRSYLWH